MNYDTGSQEWLIKNGGNDYEEKRVHTKTKKIFI